MLITPSSEYYKTPENMNEDEKKEYLEERRQGRISFFRNQLKNRYSNYISKHIDEFINRMTPEEILEAEIGVYLSNPRLFEEFFNHDIFITQNIKDTPEYKKAVLEKKL